MYFHTPDRAFHLLCAAVEDGRVFTLFSLFSSAISFYRCHDEDVVFSFLMGDCWDTTQSGDVR
jgi:hypothetical protein